MLDSTKLLVSRLCLFMRLSLHCYDVAVGFPNLGMWICPALISRIPRDDIPEFWEEICTEKVVAGVPDNSVSQGVVEIVKL